MHGGPRPGSGRKPGSKPKKAAARAEAIAIAGIEPKQFLLNGLAFYQRLITEEEAKPVPNPKTIARLYAEGKPFAVDVAGYCHSKLAAIEHKGPNNGPVQVVIQGSDKGLL